MQVNFNTNSFMKDINNIVSYAEGFLEGSRMGKTALLENIGMDLMDMVGEYIDVNARVNPAALQHVYEWGSTGDPAGRLFSLKHSVSSAGLSISSTFKTSQAIKSGSSVPFYNKAKIMEDGTPVTITPKAAGMLVFETDGETVFTRSPVTVENPGGPEAAGGFSQAFKEFFGPYLSQSMLSATGIMNNLKNPIDFDNNLNAGRLGGSAVGYKVGYNWVSRKVT
jgi:hypothetical protein